MGTVISKGLNGVGAILGNAFLAPFNALFGNSCEGVCAGTWNFICFIEHFCISSLIKLVMVLTLCYITFLFFYLLFKVGIIQCVIRGFCKMSWSACEAYWSALEGICCFLWYKLKNTKRVYRGHHRYDLEEGYPSRSDDDDDGYSNMRSSRRKSFKMKRRRDHHMNRSLHMVRWRHKSKRYFGGGGSSHRHQVRLRSGEVSVHLKSSQYRRKRKDQIKNRSDRKRMVFKRRGCGD